MSDNMHKGLGDQVQEKATPDSQKSTLDKASESASGAYDRAAAAVQPEGNKSATQKAGDAARGGSDDAEGQGKGMLASAQETIGNTAQSIQDTISGNTKQ